MYKVTLNKGTSYFDPKTNTSLKLSKKTRTFSDEELERLDMENIEFAINVNVLKKTEVDAEEVVQEETNEVKQEVTEEPVKEETEEVLQEEELALEEFTDDGDPRCQEITGSGSQCKNAAKYPEEDPKYCGTHKKDEE
jgi:hypothetical protein